MKQFNMVKEINNLSRDSLLRRVEWYEKKYGPYVEERGLKNWKNLFKKPSLQDCMVLILLLLLFYSAWAYSKDVALCREIISNSSTFVGVIPGG